MTELLENQLINLTVRSKASFLHASCDIDAIIAKAQSYRNQAVGLADYGNLFNIIKFYKAAKQANIKPILGCTVYLCQDIYEQKQQKIRAIDHITLIAENQTGWRNLVRLVSASYQDDNFFFFPRIDFNLLDKYKEGLIILSGGIPDSIISKNLLGESPAIFKAEAIVRRLIGVVGTENFFLEVQPGYTKVNDQLRNIARKYNLQTVLTNNVHYIEQSEAEAHKTLLKMNASAYNKLTHCDFSSDIFYFSNETNGFTEEEVRLTQDIANRCNVEIDLKKHRLPKYKFLPAGDSAIHYLRRLTHLGLSNICSDFDEIKTKLYTQRAERELLDIDEMGFADYFLIVQDVLGWCRSQGMLLGKGRGSAAGSLVCYALGITEVDPIQYNLIWERFLNKGRIQLPDIDSDVPRSRRQEVLGYIKERFGNVAQLINFNGMQARAILKEVFRVFEMPFDEANKITSLIPLKDEDHSDISIHKALEMSPELQKYEKKYKAWFEIAKSLEGCYKNTGIHAAAVIISDEPFEDSDYLLARSKDGTPLFGWDMDDVDSLHLLKLDILGLSTLDDVQETFNLIKERHNINISRETIPLDDKKTFDIFTKGLTTGVFQLETQLGRNWSKKVSPKNINEISDLTSILRPGPLDSGLSNNYIENKKGNAISIHPKIDVLTKDTYLQIVYQEQVINIFRELAGWNLSDCDIGRKEISKKNIDKVKELKTKFIFDCQNHSKISKQDADDIWSKIETFAGYGFNRCFYYKTKVLLPNGETPTIKELYNQKYRGSICSINPRTGFYQESVVEDIMLSGTTDSYNMRLINNDSVNVTMGHKFITPYGPKVLNDLKVNDYIATIQKINLATQYNTSIDEALLVGCLISEGNLCHPSALYFASSREEERQYFITLAKRFKNTDCVLDSTKDTVHTKRINIKEPQGAFEYCKKIGILNHIASEKFLPPEILFACEESVAAFLGAAWTGDGHIGGNIYYATSSEQLMKDIRFLCLRLGIVTSFNKRNFKYIYKGVVSNKIGYVINILGKKSWNNFRDNISPYLFGKKLEDFNKIKNRTYKFSGRYDGLPRQFMSAILNELYYSGFGNGSGKNSLKRLCQKAGISSRVFNNNNQKTISYYWLEKLNAIVQSDKLESLIKSDIAWLPIDNITRNVKSEVYDITVKDTHTLIADNILAMNSHAIAYSMLSYETAYLKANYPIEFFCAKLKTAKDHPDKLERIGALIYDAKLFDIKVLPPQNSIDFTIINNREIAFGLGTIKGVGKGTAKIILSKLKEHQLFDDFILDSHGISSSAMEALIKSGALDIFKMDRVRMLAKYQLMRELSPKELEVILNNRDTDWIQTLNDLTKDDAKEKFGIKRAPDSRRKVKINEIINAFMAYDLFDNLIQNAKWEQEYLGISLTSHAMHNYKGYDKCLQLARSSMEGDNFDIIVEIMSSRQIFTRKGDPMAFISGRDETFALDSIVVFPKTYEKSKNVLEKGNIIRIKGRVDSQNSFIANKIERIK